MFVCFLLVAGSPVEETNYLLTRQGPKSGRNPGLPPGKGSQPAILVLLRTFLEEFTQPTDVG